MEEDGFKVLGKILPGGVLFPKGMLTSAILCGYITEYHPNENTYPLTNCGPLAVFRNLEDATSFNSMHCASICVIYTCKFTQSKETKLWVPENSQSLKSCPEGTVLADMIRILERVA